MIQSAHTSSALGERERLLARLDAALAPVDELFALGEARFLETHAIFEGRSDQRQRIIDWFGAEIAPAVPPDRPYRVLSVGCGSGLLDVPVASQLAARTSDLRYVGVNPNRVECEGFQRAFDQASLRGVSVDVARATFDAFEPSGSFDLIHFVHCLYYMPDPASSLVKARRLLAPGGRLIAFHAPCGVLNDLALRFWNKHYDRPTLFAEDIAQLLDRWGWRYERDRVDARVEVTPLTHVDAETGLALRDFIVQFDSERLPAAVQRLVDRYLRLVTVPDRDERFVAHPVDVFAIGG